MEELLKLLVKPLVDNFESVRIEKQPENNHTKYVIFVPKSDIAKVIGKEGKMIKSIKNLVKIRAIKMGLFVTIEVQEI